MGWWNDVWQNQANYPTLEKVGLELLEGA